MTCGCQTVLFKTSAQIISSSQVKVVSVTEIETTGDGALFAMAKLISQENLLTLTSSCYKQGDPAKSRMRSVSLVGIAGPYSRSKFRRLLIHSGDS